jgi:predicted Zn-dependent protease
MTQHDCDRPDHSYKRTDVERTREAIEGWVEQMKRMQQVDRDLGQRLMACATPAEAVAVSSEWMARRIDSLMALQHRLIEMWLDHARSGLVRAIPTGGKRKHDHDG